MMKEDILFRKMQEGDWSALGSFFDCYAEQLFHYALGFVKHRAEAEDIVQDVFIYLWTNRDKIAYTGSVYAYLCRAVKNSCIDYKLHEKVEERYRQEMMALVQEDTGEEDDFEELYARLQEVMNTLPPKCREIFVLGCVEGMSYKEIAEQLDISVNTVKTQMKTAYKKIKDEFGDKDKRFMMILLVSFK